MQENQNIEIIDISNDNYSKENVESDKQLSEITKFDLPKDYSLGSIVNYILSDQTQIYPFNKFVVAGNELFFSQDGAIFYGPQGFRFEFSTKLYGIDEGNWNKTKEK